MDQPFSAPDPFSQVPSTRPDSTNPPAAPQPERTAASGPNRGRMAVAALAAVGLVGAGVFGVSKLATGGGSGDRSALAMVTDDAIDDATGDEATNDAVEVDPAAVAADDEDGERGGSGEIAIDTGDGDPVTIGLDEVGAEQFDEFRECLDLPELDLGELDLGELDLGELDLGELDLPDLDLDDLALGLPGNQITVFGPDGIQVVDLGEGDGSVTITKRDGELTIETDGDATVAEASELLGDFLADPELIDDLDIERVLEDLPFEVPDFDELPDLDRLDIPDFEFPDADQVERCLDMLRS